MKKLVAYFWDTLYVRILLTLSRSPGLHCVYRVPGFTSSLRPPKSQRECITRQRTRSSNILSCWMLEYGDYNTLPIRGTPRSFDLVLDFISRSCPVHWIFSVLLFDGAQTYSQIRFLLNVPEGSIAF